MSDVFLKSPNRLQDTRVRNAIEVIANFVEMIPEINVKFEPGTFILSTQKYYPVNSTTVELDFKMELDTIAKNIEKYLKDIEKFTKVKVEPLGVDVRGMGWSTFRTILYVGKATYKFEV